MSSDAEDTADVARRIALNLSGHDRQIANVLLRTAELAVLRRLVAATLPGGLAEYWRLVEQELTS